jgi:hypothetical protein
MGEIWKSIYLDHRFFFASGSFSSKGKLKRQKKKHFRHNRTATTFGSTCVLSILKKELG